MRKALLPKYLWRLEHSFSRWKVRIPLRRLPSAWTLTLGRIWSRTPLCQLNSLHLVKRPFLSTSTTLILICPCQRSNLLAAVAVAVLHFYRLYSISKARLSAKRSWRENTNLLTLWWHRRLIRPVPTRPAVLIGKYQQLTSKLSQSTTTSSRVKTSMRISMLLWRPMRNLWPR